MLSTTDYDNVTRIKMGRELNGQVLYWVSAYLVDGLLIDSGCSHTAEELLSFLADKEVKQVYLTHYHEDHTGGCALLQEKLKLQVMATPETVKLAANAPPLYPYQELVWGYPQKADFQAIPGSSLSTENHSFRIIKTPGHSPDHTVLVEPVRGWCFSGDLFVSENIKVLRPEEDIGLLIESLKKLHAVKLDRPGRDLTLFTALGKIHTRGRESIKNCIDHLENLKREAVRLSRDEGLDAEDIVRHLFGAESSLAGLTDGQFASANLINSLLKIKPA